jgi:1,4-dihydroxy-2-naphthoyl-CoA hydrolase
MDLSDVPYTGYDRVVGLRIDSLEQDRVRASFDVRDELRDSSGALHRGVISGAFESVASVAAAAWFSDRGHVVGVANSTSHFKSVREGRLEVLAVPVNRQAERQLWEVSLLNEAGELVAHSEVQLANIADAAVLGRG